MTTPKGTLYLFRLHAIARDGTQTELGELTLTGETYGDRSEADALRAFHDQLEVRGSFLLWQGHSLARADVARFTAVLEMKQDLDAAEPEAQD